jgi:hypothetical protein
VTVDVTFEVIRFEIVPAGGVVAVIELEGRPHDALTLTGRPVLLLEGPVEQVELQPIADLDGAEDGVVSATFAAPLELAVDSATTFALSLGRGPLVELPAPDGLGDIGLEVRLARTVNALRTELHETRAHIGERELAAEREGAAAARAAAKEAAEREAAEERERLLRELADANAELAELRHELLEAHWHVTELEAAAVPRVPRPPRPPGGRVRRPHTRPHRLAEATAEHEPVVRRIHASLGRSTARTAVLIFLALLLAALVVLVLQVRVV